MLSAQQEILIKETLRKYEPSLVGIFGSYARNEQTSLSDIDILVDFHHQINLLDLIGLEQELSEQLGIQSRTIR